MLTARIWDWAVYYKDTVEKARNDEWETHAYRGHVADGIVELAPFGDMVPQEVQDEMDAAKEKMLSGELHPFTGLVRDHYGKVRVAEGETMTDEALFSFDWLVVGQIPE